MSNPKLLSKSLRLKGMKVIAFTIRDHGPWRITRIGTKCAPPVIGRCAPNAPARYCPRQRFTMLMCTSCRRARSCAAPLRLSAPAVFLAICVTPYVLATTSSSSSSREAPIHGPPPHDPRASRPDAPTRKCRGSRSSVRTLTRTPRDSDTAKQAHRRNAAQSRSRWSALRASHQKRFTSPRPSEDMDAGHFKIILSGSRDG